MKTTKILFKACITAFLTVSLTIGLPSTLFAQNEQGEVVMPGRSGADPAVEYPPRAFATAEAHYNYLMEEANGGTQHTMATIPVWDGLWSAGYNSMPSIFLEGGNMGIAMRPGGTVKTGVLTPAYEQHFRERRTEIEINGSQLYDRLTN